MDLGLRPDAPADHRRWVGALLLGAGSVGLLLAAVTLLAGSRQQPDRPVIFGIGVALGALAAFVATRPRWRPRRAAWLVLPAITVAGVLAGLLWSQQSIASDGYCVLTTHRGTPFEWLGQATAQASTGPAGPIDAATCAAQHAEEVGLDLLPAGLILDLVFWGYVGLLGAVAAGLGRSRPPAIATGPRPEVPLPARASDSSPAAYPGP